jgi:hypothetical protein
VTAAEQENTAARAVAVDESAGEDGVWDERRDMEEMDTGESVATCERGSVISEGEGNVACDIVDGVTDEEALQRGLSSVGRYRVATPADIRASLLLHTDRLMELPDQRGVFNEGTLNCHITQKTRMWILEHCSKFAMCIAPGCSGGPPCEHFPAAVKAPEDVLLRVPVVYDENDDAVVAIFVLPGTTIIRAWLSDPVIAASLVEEPLEREGPHDGNSSFCAGLYFEELLQAVPEGHVPICIACYSDETTVVGVGTRSFHIASLALLNSTLSSLDTVRPVMLLPKLKDLITDLSDGHLRRMKLLVFHAAWEAVAQASGVQIGNAPFRVACSERGIVSVYPVFSLFVGDTPEQNKVQGHRNGGATEEICARCCATVDDNGFSNFMLRLDRKKVVDTLLQRIVKKVDVRQAREELKHLSLHDVLPFTDRLRHFDASICCPTCSLHVGRLLWTKTLIQLVGHLSCAPAAGAESVAKHGRQASGRDPDNLQKCINEQFQRFFPRFGVLFDRNGELDIGVKTGKVLTEIVEALPFILFNILPEELRFVQWWNGCAACVSG